MPLLRSIEKTADGFIITRSNGSVLSLTSADIPANIKNKTIAEVQTWVNNWLATNNYSAVCRIRSVTPLDIDIVVGANLPANYFSLVGVQRL